VRTASGTFNSVVLGLLLGIFVVGCGSETGACVIEGVLGSQYNHCVNGDTPDECSALGSSHHSGGKSCADLGFKKVCADDPQNTYRMSCP
jgi:hypothetical protein